MKNMLTAAFAAVLLALPMVASAQQAPPPPEHGMRGGIFSQLTDQQRQQIMPVMQQAHQQMQTIQASAFSREMAALSADHRARVQAIISSLPARPPRGDGANGAPPPPPNGAPPMGGFGHGGGFGQYAQQIDAILTPQESAAVIAIGRDARTQSETVMKNAMQQVRQYLTADQQSEFDQMAQHRAQFGGHENLQRAEDAGRDLLAAARSQARGEHLGQ